MRRRLWGIDRAALVLVAGTCAVSTLAACAPAETPASESWTRGASVEGITDYVLPNGLTVLLCPDVSRPTFTTLVVYRVGSRYEGLGEAGMAHMLEHMLIKSTESFASLGDSLAARGADYNGETWFDRTFFFETLPADGDNLDFALRLEAERMTRAVLDPGELAKEMDVITNEFEMIENDPAISLSYRTMSAAFMWHAYGRATVGNLSDIRRYPVDSLRRFYERFYQPDNAVLYVSGRFESQRVLRLIDEHFGALPRPDRILPRTLTVEPVQDGPRRVTLKRAGGLPLVSVLYHVPAAAHPDCAPVQILREILIDSPSGLLYELVETGAASAVRPGDSDAAALAEPGALELLVEVAPGGDAEGVLARTIHLTEGLAERGITEEEVALAKARLLKRIRRTIADSERLGAELSDWIAAGDWRLFFLHRDRLARVSADDVERVARAYLVEDSRTAGLYLPTSKPIRAAIPAAPDPASLVADYRGGEEVAAAPGFFLDPRSIAEQSLKLTLPPGLEVVVLNLPTRGNLVRAVFRFHYGSETTLAGRAAATQLLPKLLARGTRRRDHRELERAITLLQSDIRIGGQDGVVGVTLESDREHFCSAIELLGEMLTEPGLSEDEFEIVKSAELSRLESEASDPVRCCFNVLRRRLYPWPESSIHYMPSSEEAISRMRAASFDEVKGLYEDLLGASHAEAAVVGDFEKGRVLQALGEAFGSWASPAPYERVGMPYRPIRAGRETVTTPGKQMAIVAMGTLLELRDDDPDYAALKLAGYLLTEKDRARLDQRLRYDLGLSYHVGGRLETNSQDRNSYLFAYAFCSPAMAESTLSAMTAETRRWIEEGVTEEELAAAQDVFALEFRTRCADDEFLAEELVRGLELERSFAAHADLQEKIQALTAEDVHDALARHFAGRPFIEVAAGDLPGAAR